MPYLSSVIDHINTTLKNGKLNRHSFQGGNYRGLAKQVSKLKGEFLVPVIYDLSGNEFDVTIDDTFPIHLYHRITSPITYTQDIKGKSFGDGGETVVENINLSCIVFSDPKRISMTAEDLSFLIVTGLPSQFTANEIGGSKIGSVLVTPLNAETSPLKVLAQEHGQGFKEFDPEKILISINYKIEMTVDKSCMTCATC